ncbi:MAG: hypothetical protein GY809_17535 [Planctomycetes bacterium]|nr:hypothetical protein [Planctomycetota bacterium]
METRRAKPRVVPWDETYKKNKQEGWKDFEDWEEEANQPYRFRRRPGCLTCKTKRNCPYHGLLPMGPRLIKVAPHTEEASELPGERFRRRGELDLLYYCKRCARPFGSGGHNCGRVQLPSHYFCQDCDGVLPARGSIKYSPQDTWAYCIWCKGRMAPKTISSHTFKCANRPVKQRSNWVYTSCKCPAW